MNIFRKIMVLAIVGLFMGAGVLPSITGNYIEEKNDANEEIVVLQVGGDGQCIGSKKIKMPLSEAEQIKTKLTKLGKAANAGDIDGPTFINCMLTIFRGENILPPEYTYENITKFAQCLFYEIKGEHSLKNLLPCDSLPQTSFPRKPFAMNNNNSPDMQMGLITLKASFAIGGPFGWGIPITPFPSMQEVIWNESFDFFGIFPNSSAKLYWSLSPNVILFLPGAPLGGHGIASLIPFPGMEAYRTAAFWGKACFGIGIGLASISIVAYYQSEIAPSTLFEATFQITLGDFLISYTPPT